VMASPDPRDAIHDAIQTHAPIARAEGAILTGWIVVAEWMAQDGERWLSKAYASATPQWTATGMIYEVLHGEWPKED
jgi:hypothetical protein